MLSGLVPQGANITVLNINPLVMVLDGFLGSAECEALIALGQGRLQRATLFDAHGAGAVSEGRTNSQCLLSPAEAPQVLPILMKLGIALRMPMDHGEGLMMLHYGVTQEFRPHSDGIAMDASPERRAQFERLGGQRLFSTLIYLNAVEGGGGTAFPELDLSVAPRPGRLLIFANTMAGTRDTAALSLHAGEPVTAGEKWAAIAWWRERPVPVD